MGMSGVLDLKAGPSIPPQAELGRFISRDPIGFRGGLNLFNGASTNPVTFVDPAGLTPYSPQVAIAPGPSGDALPRSGSGAIGAMGCGGPLGKSSHDSILDWLTVPGPYGSANPSEWGRWNDLRGYVHENGGIPSRMAFDVSYMTAGAAAAAATHFATLPVVSIAAIVSAAEAAGLNLTGIPVLEGTAGSLTASGYILSAECATEVHFYEKAIYLSRLGRQSIANGVRTLFHEAEHLAQAAAGIPTRSAASEAAAIGAEKSAPSLLW